LNNPKQATVGSTNRGRISSQCQFYWIRQAFQDYLIDENLGIRTQDIGRIIYDALLGERETDFSVPEVYEKKKALLAAMVVSDYMGKSFPTKTNFKKLASTAEKLVDDLDSFEGESDTDTKGSPIPKLSKVLKTDASAFYHHQEIVNAVEAAVAMLNDCFATWPETQADMETRYDASQAHLEVIYDENLMMSPDVALFGRMMAQYLHLKVFSPVFPSHNITTNEVDIDFDLFTATDDYRDVGSKTDGGSDHLNSNGFIQGVFYATCTVDVHKLHENLGWDEERTRKILRAFVKAYFEVAPGAKRTSFGLNSEPFYMRIEKTDLLPVTYHLAFSKPVEGDDIAVKSVECLERYAAAYESKRVTPEDEFEAQVWCRLPDKDLGGHLQDMWGMLE